MKTLNRLKAVLLLMQKDLITCSISKRLCAAGKVEKSLYLSHKIHGKDVRAPVIMVIHGLLGMKRNWKSISVKLSEITGNAVICVDVRNHGESPHHDSHTYEDLAGDMSNLMDTLNIDTATLIGHSMGGRTAMFLALIEPYIVHRLIVVDISPITTPSSLEDFARLTDAMLSITFEATDTGNAREEAKTKLLQSGVLREGDILNFILLNVGIRKADNKIGWLCNVKALKENFHSIASFPRDSVKGKNYNGPTLFIGGEDSDYLPKGDHKAIKTMFPKAEFVYIKGAGHNVHSDNQTEFIEVVTDFIKANPS